VDFACGEVSVRLWQFYVVSGRQYRIAYWHASGITVRASASDVAAVAALVYRLSADSSVCIILSVLDVTGGQRCCCCS